MFISQEKCKWHRKLLLQ